MPTAWDNLTNTGSTNIPKIAVCIPYNGNWYPEWVDKTYIPLKVIPTNWCTKLIFLSKVQSLPVARDILANNALQSGCDYIFFLDTDHIFEFPEDPNIALNQLYQLINKSKDNKDTKIISGLYRAKQKIGFNYAMWMKYEDKGFTPVREWTGNWLEVDVAGLGCCLIDTQVFKNIQKPWFYWEDGNAMSEDFYFYQLAKKHGYNTHIFTDVKLSHLGNLKVKIDGTITTQDM